MSFQAMTWAVRQELPVREKMVLLMLANRVNADTGRCDPSIQRLATDCGMSKDSVRRAITALAGRGLIEVLRRSREGVQLPNHYRIAAGPEDGIAPPADDGDPDEGGVSLRGVVAHSEGGSRTQRGGVVAVCDPNQEDKPGREPDSFASLTPALPEEVDPAPDDPPSLFSADAPTPAEKRKAEPDRFDDFWRIYPRRTAKGDARKAWAKAVRKHPPDAILRAAERFAKASAGTEARFIPHPATWLNGERWGDEAVGGAAAAPAKRTLAHVTPALRDWADRPVREWPRWASRVQDAAIALRRRDAGASALLEEANGHRRREGLPPLTLADATPDLGRVSA